MDIKKLLIIVLVAVAVLSSAATASAGLFDGFLMPGNGDNVVDIGPVTFNTTNVTVFKFNDTYHDEESGANFSVYTDDGDACYTVNIFNGSSLNDSQFMDMYDDYESWLESNSSQTIDDVVVYTTSANIGEHAGETRYATIVLNEDLKIIVDICTPDANETAKMAKSLKFN